MTVVGYIEQASSKEHTREWLIDKLEQEYPEGYSGESSAPDNASVMFLSHGLSKLIWNRPEEVVLRESTYRSLYRAVDFSVRVAGYLASSDVVLNPVGTLDDNKSMLAANGEDVIVKLHATGDSYLTGHPNIASVVNQFSERINPEDGDVMLTAALCGVLLRTYDAGYDYQQQHATR